MHVHMCIYMGMFAYIRARARVCAFAYARVRACVSWEDLAGVHVRGLDCWWGGAYNLPKQSKLIFPKTHKSKTFLKTHINKDKTIYTVQLTQVVSSHPCSQFIP